jgi:regulator of protease activity HflC (stomatin/prohibitin superfamily)
VRYEIKNIDMEPGFTDILNAQAEAERVKRAEITSSEGTKQSLINVAEGEKSKNILEAEGRAEMIYLKCKALSERLTQVAESINQKDVNNSGLKLNLSEKVFETLEKLAKEENNLILSQDMNDPSKVMNSMINDFDKSK